MTIAFLAASFDPITKGHEGLIESAAGIFEKLIVGVGTNPAKTSGLFDDKTRLRLVQKSCDKWPNVTVIQLPNEYSAGIARRMGATVLVRGVRSSTDFEYEQTLRHVNEQIAPQLTTVYLTPTKKLETVSSSLVKGLVGPNGWLSVVRELVSPHVLDVFIQQQLVLKSKSINRYVHEKSAGYLVTSPYFYKTEDRYYHTPEHVLACLEELDSYVLETGAYPDVVHKFSYPEKKTTNPLLISLSQAIWYHDCVYKTDIQTYSDGTPWSNEEESARVYLDHSYTYKPESDLVVDMIRATKNHISTGTPECDLFLDIDLSILGKSPSEYARYASNIRKEWAHVPDDSYRTGRIDVMRKFIDREFIYYTSFFRDRYETQARANIAAEIKSLTA